MPLNDRYELKLPMTPNEEAVGYLAFYHNFNNLKELSVLDELVFSYMQIVVFTYIFTNRETNAMKILVGTHSHRM